MQNNPFQNLKVVELASVLAGPAVGMFFAELGAEVVKIENAKTGGDVTRNWKGPTEDSNSKYSAYYHSVNWGKESLLLDLGDPEDRIKAIAYISEADILITNFKKGSAAKLGMEYEWLKAKNPSLVQANLTGFGEDDPAPAFDMVLQAEMGFMYMNGYPNSLPAKMPVALIDLLAAHQMKEAILVALLQRERTKKGSYVSVSLAESAIASLANQASNWLNAGFIPQPMGSAHPNIAPYGDIFTTQDARNLVLAIGTEKSFKQLCKALEMPEVGSSPLFETNALRVKNRAELIPHIQNKIESLDFNSVIQVLEENSIPHGVIKNMKEVFETPLAQSMVLSQVLKDGTVAKSVKTAVFKIKG